MMSKIKDKRWENDDDKSSEHSQNAKIVICQESNITFEKIIQFETRDDNKKTFNYRFSENDVVDYTIFVEKKRTRNKNLKIKKED